MSTLVAAVRGWSKIDFLGWMLSPAPEAPEAFIVWAWRYLLGHLIFRYSASLLSNQSFSLYPALYLGLISAALLLSFAPSRFTRFSKLLAMTTVALEMSRAFPINPNHCCLETLLLVLLLLVDFHQVLHRELLVAMGRWIITLIMVYSSLQKILHGEYFNGMFFAERVNNERFRPFLKLVLHPEEFQALRQTLQSGLEAPLVLHSPGALVISNLVYLSELLVAFLLLGRRTRVLGATLGLLILVAIEVVARELTFGLLALNLFMLFFPLRWRRRVAISSGFTYLCLAIVCLVVGHHAFT